MIARTSGNGISLDSFLSTGFSSEDFLSEIKALFFYWPVCQQTIVVAAASQMTKGLDHPERAPHPGVAFDQTSSELKLGVAEYNPEERT